MTLTYHYQPAFHNILVWKINNVGLKRMKYRRHASVNWGVELHISLSSLCLSTYKRYQNTRNNILGTFSMSSDTGNSPSSLIWLGFTGSWGLGAAPLSPFSAEEFCGGCGCDGGATGSELFSFKFSLDLKLI